MEGADEDEYTEEGHWKFFWVGRHPSEHRICEEDSEDFVHDEEYVLRNPLWILSPEDPNGPSQGDFWAPSSATDRGQIRIAQQNNNPS
eukprot:CAMPEP_0173416266 /NCGR_PEP_ID=MMETSP1356-20130122/85298_1 /TAXON_ID=77927 ORGANISM="Hemiselmis virescens, Strain PCC157" /NCGR_SAMPLE_ID=MMETSP1356 /ASSEMBLY_ACC=CAM_ASM_000847 /LENGTH=87 /DNA_ID=CAMNT_0014378571 /DNA_START=428 /DNA_END=691 /DNA_ORIENTATION=-